MAANPLPPQPPQQWAVWNDSHGHTHKCLRQKLWASCVPACMAMMVRSISIIKEAYQEANARGELRSVMPPNKYYIFNETGISLKYVPDALSKIGIKTAVYQSGVVIDAAHCTKYFSFKKPGIVGVSITTGGKLFEHAMVCKGALPNGDILFICPAYGPHEVPPLNVGNFALTDMWNLGTPTPATAAATGEIVKLY
jgi:hypothetical protein